MAKIVRLAVIEIFRLPFSPAITFIRTFPNSLINYNMLRLLNALKKPFATEALNQRISDKDPMTQERLDSHLNRYGQLFRAFVLKRRMLRSEIWPKIHVLQEVAVGEKPHLEYQKLFSLKKSMKDSTMQAIAKNDPSRINSAFIISNFCEEHFKEMLDQYVGKVLVCGKAPGDSPAQARVEKEVYHLYKAFFFGQKSSALERELQQAYLSAKQFKFLKSQRQKANGRQFVEEVKWTERQQRILEEKSNWVPASPTLTDLNFRTFFEPLEYPQRVGSFLKFQKLQRDWTTFQDLKFRWFTSRYYNPKKSQFYDWVQEKLFVRMMSYIRSTEFTTTLNIPHDYMIQAQIVQIHFWLVVDRLKKIGSAQALTLAKRISLTLSMELVRSAQSVNLKKSNVLTTTLQRMLDVNSNILELHFNRSQLTRHTPYKGIDAMVWSIAFAEKVHRYADQVYLFSDYLAQNFTHLQRHSLQDILNGLIEFDPYLIRPNHRALIEQVNPPLSAAEFQQQFKSNSAEKDYYYSKVQREIEAQIPIQDRVAQSKVDTSFGWAQFVQPFRNLRMKYMTLSTMDHYNKMEEQKESTEKQDKEGVWRSGKDEVRKVHSEFERVKGMKNERRRINQEEKRA